MICPIDDKSPVHSLTTDQSRQIGLRLPTLTTVVALRPSRDRADRKSLGNPEVPRPQTKTPPAGGALAQRDETRLQRRFDLKAPSFEKCLRDILGILVAASPLAQAG